MTKISDALTYGITIRESATDGSDFTNPAADYRRLFLGEDGLLHVKDSAGAVTDPYTAGGAMATDALWDAAGDLAVGTGANTGAKLTKGADGGVLAMGNSAVIWNAGTSFPGSKATGDRYWRTDLGLEFYWDGTRWLSTSLFREPLSGGVALLVPDSAGTTSGYLAPWHSTFDLWLLDFYSTVFVNGTNDGSNYWTVNLNHVTAANSATSLANFTTASYTTATWTTATTSVAALLAPATYKTLTVSAAKTLSPGTLYYAYAVSYRLVGT